MQLGMIGLGRMGANLVRRLMRDGHECVAYDVVKPSIDELADAPLLTRRSIQVCRNYYAPEGSDLTDPMLSPLFGTLEGLPPALIQTADQDPLRDDGTRYANALESAGVRVRLTNYVRAPHGFASFPGVFAAGAQHRAELVAEIRSHLHAPDAPLAPQGR